MCRGLCVCLRGQDLRYEPWDEMGEVLAHVDVLKSDAVEAEYLTGKTDIYGSREILRCTLGPSEIVLTHRDGLLIYANGEFHDRSFHPENLLRQVWDEAIPAWDPTCPARMDKSPEEAATVRRGGNQPQDGKTLPLRPHPRQNWMPSS